MSNSKPVYTWSILLSSAWQVNTSLHVSMSGLSPYKRYGLFADSCRAKMEAQETTKTPLHTLTTSRMKHISSQITPYFYTYIDKGQQSLVVVCSGSTYITSQQCVSVHGLFLFQMDWPFSKGQAVTPLTCTILSRTLGDTKSQTGSNTGTTLGPLFHAASKVL